MPLELFVSRLRHPCKQRRTYSIPFPPTLHPPFPILQLTHLEQKLEPVAHQGNPAQKPIDGEKEEDAHPPLGFSLGHVPSGTRRPLPEIGGQKPVERGEYGEVASIERGVPNEAEDDVDEEGDGGVYGPIPLLHAGRVRGHARQAQNQAQGHDGAKVEEEGETEKGEEDAFVQGHNVGVFHNLGHGLARRLESEEGLLEEVEGQLP